MDVDATTFVEMQGLVGAAEKLQEEWRRRIRRSDAGLRYREVPVSHDPCRLLAEAEALNTLATVEEEMRRLSSPRSQTGVGPLHQIGGEVTELIPTVRAELPRIAERGTELVALGEQLSAEGVELKAEYDDLVEQHELIRDRVAQWESAGGTRQDERRLVADMERLDIRLVLVTKRLEAHRHGQKAVMSLMKLLSNPIQLLSDLPPVVAAIDEAERRRKTTARARRLARLAHPITQFLVLLLLGVVAVNMATDMLSSLDRVWIWGFSILAFVLIDYVLEPRLERWMRAHALKLMATEASAVGVASHRAAMALQIMFVIGTTVPELSDLASKSRELNVILAAGLPSWEEPPDAPAKVV